MVFCLCGYAVTGQAVSKVLADVAPDAQESTGLAQVIVMINESRLLAKAKSAVLCSIQPIK
jgi:hypothetical protein